MRKNYEELFNFLGAWFPDIDFEGLTEKDVVAEYRKTITKRELQTVISQAKEVRNRIENYWRFLSQYTNVYFKNSEAALNWLNSIIELLEA